jgi:hypothetical protein
LAHVIAGGLFLVVVSSAAGQAQGSAAKSTGASEGVGFAIETEMLTYRSVESNSQAVACDLAAYLYNVQPAIKNDEAGSPRKKEEGSTCAVGPQARQDSIGIVVLPFDQAVADAFQVWRADMVIMKKLIERSNAVCGQAVGMGATAATSIAGAAAALTPAGSALSLAQGVMGAFAQQTDVTPVTGTVQDQAFMDATGRQLRIYGISVLLPGSYRPATLTGIDDQKSPFLRQFRNFMAQRDCIREMDEKKPGDTTAPTAGKKSPPGLKDEMDAFYNALIGAAAVVQKPASNIGGSSANAAGDSSASTTGGSNHGPTSGSGAGTSGGATVVSAQAPAKTMGLTDILAVDGLAGQLGMDEQGSEKPTQWKHLLMLKALESGGTVTKTSNIFGSRIRYNGGAVGTFALFNFDGRLECSGNVFDFGGSVRAKDMPRALQRYRPNLASQVIFQTGACPASTSH